MYCVPCDVACCAFVPVCTARDRFSPRPALVVTNVHILAGQNGGSTSPPIAQSPRAASELAMFLSSRFLDSLVIPFRPFFGRECLGRWSQLCSSPRSWWLVHDSPSAPPHVAVVKAVRFVPRNLLEGRSVPTFFSQEQPHAANWAPVLDAWSEPRRPFPGGCGPPPFLAGEKGIRETNKGNYSMLDFC